VMAYFGWPEAHDKAARRLSILDARPFRLLPWASAVRDAPSQVRGPV